MHILLVADGRSPITKRWIEGLLSLNDQVTLVSSYPCEPIEGIDHFFILPIAFSKFSSTHSSRKPTGVDQNRKPGIFSKFIPSALSARYWLGPLTLPFYARKLNKIIAELQPDLIHALRIPFEGMLIANLHTSIPRIVSVWGNDLTLHAPGSKRMAKLTRKTLSSMDGIIADTKRDIQLSQHWGAAKDLPTLVVPGGGGINLTEIYQAANLENLSFRDLPAKDIPWVINPRGIRAYAQTDVFFEAIPLTLQYHPEVHFICPAMAGKSEAEGLVKKYHLEKNVHLLPELSQPELWNLFHQSEISVSLTTHDGTPNTLLEAMACGCFPIAGDLESLREWITPGANGMLVEPSKAQSLADALIISLENPQLRSQAAEINLKNIREKTNTDFVRAQIDAFYHRIIPSVK
ncbi:MAG: glycosyltransferase family 4 protein [Anaerolineaceae bacterium]